MPIKNESGKTYGKLYVTEQYRLTTDLKYNYAEWFCHCSCGSSKWVNGANLRANRITSCGCARKEHPNWGQKYLPLDSKYFFKAWYVYWLNKTISKGRRFDLTIQQLDQIYDRQDGKCFYTNQPFILATQAKHCLLESNISLDRIDISQGYSLDNVVMCTKMVNIARNVCTQQDFIDMCRQVARNPTLTRSFPSAEQQHPLTLT